MKRRNTLIFMVILLVFIGSFSVLSNENHINKTRKNFNVYLKSGDEYVLQETSSFPKTGYVLNTSESSCTNGGTISQNSTTKEITVEVTKSDKCNFYFDSETIVTLNKLKSLNSNIELKTTSPDFSKISPLPTEYQDNGIGSTEESYTPPVNTSYITYGDNYTFDTTTGKYSLTNPQTCKWDECFADLTGKYYTYNSLYTDTSLHNQNNQQTLYQITSNSTSTQIFYKTASRVATAYDSKDTGLFSMEDDLGESLYFRGNITNNYVKFGKDKNNNDMFWRIIRINGDGTLRIIYDGTSAHENGESSSDRLVGTSAFNSASGNPYDAGYVGYMYGDFAVPTGCSCTSRDSSGNCIYTCTGGGSTSYEEAHENVNSSTIKIYLENWYLENIVNTGYESDIADEIFCNDRSIDKTKRPNDLGYGQNFTIFASYSRLSTSRNPSLKCSQKSDTFTRNLELGNKKLTYPIGLITADEITVGGNIYNADSTQYNNKSYLFKGTSYWTSSSDALTDKGLAYVAHMTSSGYIGGTWSYNNISVAPVINLKTDYISSFVGDGTMNNPFRAGA